MVWNHTCNFYSKSPWIMQLPNEIQCDLHIPMEKRAKHKQKWNGSKVIEKDFYNIALQKRALWLANVLDPFACRLHSDVSLFVCLFVCFFYIKRKIFKSLNAIKEMASVQLATIDLRMHAGGCYARKKCKRRTRRERMINSISFWDQVANSENRRKVRQTD